jgi:hypothetical protein
LERFVQLEGFFVLVGGSLGLAEGKFVAVSAAPSLHWFEKESVYHSGSSVDCSGGFVDHSEEFDGLSWIVVV